MSPKWWSHWYPVVVWTAMIGLSGLCIWLGMEDVAYPNAAAIGVGSVSFWIAVREFASWVPPRRDLDDEEDF